MSGPAMARRWNSADLLNITPDVISRILADQKVLAAVRKIQGFANPRSELASFVNRAKEIGKLKAKAKEGNKKAKKELSELEKAQARSGLKTRRSFASL